MTQAYLNEMWDLAQTTAKYSKDPSTKVGAVAARNKRVLGTGRNGFPPGIPDSIDLYSDRKLKMLLATHAETNLIAAAALEGVALGNADLFVTFPTCNECAKVIIPAGFKRVFTIKFEDRSSEWYHRWNLSKVMFRLVGIETYEYNNGKFYESFPNEYDTIEKATEKLARHLAFITGA